MKTISAVAALSIVGLLACEPVANPVEVDSPNFDKGGQGQGAEFFTNPFIGIQHGNGQGDVCLILSDIPETGMEDFVRFDRKGKEFIHVVDRDVPITVFTAGGDVFTGSGKWNLSWYRFWQDPGPQSQMSHAVGTVTDGAVTKRALCHFIRNANGVRAVRIVDLH